MSKYARLTVGIVGILFACSALLAETIDTRIDKTSKPGEIELVK